MQFFYTEHLSIFVYRELSLTIKKILQKDYFSSRYTWMYLIVYLFKVTHLPNRMHFINTAQFYTQSFGALQIENTINASTYAPHFSQSKSSEKRSKIWSTSVNYIDRRRHAEQVSHINPNLRVCWKSNFRIESYRRHRRGVASHLSLPLTFPAQHFF